MNNVITVVLIGLNISIILVMNAGLKKIARIRKPFIEIRNYVAVLGLVWLTFSLCFGLLITFDLLEASGDTMVLRAFADGFAVAVRVMFVGSVVVVVPMWGYVRVLSSKF